MKTTAPSQVRKQEAGSTLFFTQQLCTIVFLVAVASPSVRAAEIYAFGQQLSIPQNTASGSILARYYATPTQVCGLLECFITAVRNYPNGGNNAVAGPTITTNVSGISARLLINGQAYVTGEFSQPIKLSQPIEVQLLADGRQNLGGSLAGANTVAPNYYTLTMSNRTASQIYLGGTITPIAGTCSVPNQTVILPKGSLNKLSNVGSTIGMKNFQIQINNCPKGYNRVGYTLDPVGGTIANSPGVLPLAGGSTASGIKIRVENAQGVPATMGTSIKVDGYNKTADGSFAIPMQASYIRTDAVAKPGTVNGAMTVYLDYQ
ncbi:fimbrial protein [Pseudomonas chlororaphis]|uniref:fimbrial protein n=1 Tax=Pseudomonas chlororaphis TaxID=587753 RepID=UPI000F587CB5|nr:fimbrial protein [Pseudomonas chlororaphis]AZD73964.1 hypothetical protein C4K16_3606 [Pseudomonas chlororaphis subsp. aurantiaca]